MKNILVDIRGRRPPELQSKSALMLKERSSSSSPGFASHDERCSPAVERAPENVLAEVFQYLTSQRGNCSGSFRSVVAASHVCHRWRQVALVKTSLWACVTRPCLGELRALKTFFQRAGTDPLRIDLDLTIADMDLQDAVFLTLALYLARTKSLAITHDSDFGPWPERTLLETAAPLLEELSLFSDKAVVIPALLFNKTAPRLRKLKLQVIGRLPKTCTALRGVEEIVFCDPMDSVSVDDVKWLMFVCGTRLTRLSFLAKLHSFAPGTPAAERAVRGITRLDLSEGHGHLMVSTLRMFDFKTIDTIRVRASSPGTSVLLAKELRAIRSLFYLRAVDKHGLIVLADIDDRRRIFSDISPAGVDLQLNRLRPSHALLHLAELGLWEHVGPTDLSSFFGCVLPALHTLTIFVRPGAVVEVPADAVHIFDASGELRCPALRTLCFSSRTPEPGIYPPPQRCPRVPSTRIRALMQRTVRAGEHKPLLVMEGVEFVEPFAQAQWLLETFAELVLQPLVEG